MNTQSLENCISTLEKLRDAYSGHLDTKCLVELEDVIADLQKVRKRSDINAEVGELTMRALQVIAAVVHIVTNIRDWMQ